MSFDLTPHRSLYPFESHSLDRSGIRLHYLDEGSGDPVVMVHGNPTWSFYYRELILALRGSHRVIVPDHIGCGLSDKPGDDRYAYRLDSRIDDLEALLDRLELTRDLTLVVHDWGGAIGLGFATRHPERVKRLVLLNTAAFPMPEAARLPWQLASVRNWRLMGWLVQGLNAFAVVATRVACRKMSREVRRAYLAPYDSWQNRLAVLRFVQDIPLGPEDPSFATLVGIQQGLANFEKTPTLICWGEKDFVFDGAFLDQWRRELPNAEVCRFPEAGHYVLEDATAPIIERVRDFLERNPLPGGAA